MIYSIKRDAQMAAIEMCNRCGKIDCDTSTCAKRAAFKAAYIQQCMSNINPTFSHTDVVVDYDLAVVEVANENNKVVDIRLIAHPTQQKVQEQAVMAINKATSQVICNVMAISQVRCNVMTTHIRL